MQKLIYKDTGTQVHSGDEVVIGDDNFKVEAYMLSDVLLISGAGEQKNVHVSEINAEWRTK
jgi:ribosomal protein L27